MKNPKYTFYREFNTEYQLWVLLWWHHYCDVTFTQNKVWSFFHKWSLLNSFASYKKANNV